jgi:hypothetical protein
VNNDSNIHSDKVIHHFPGHPGVYQYKIDTMTHFLNSLKNNNGTPKGVPQDVKGQPLPIPKEELKANPLKEDCSISNVHLCINKTYTWENSYIKFLDNFKMDAFGEGQYKFVDKQTIIAIFGGREHNITFNDVYTKFSSTRKGDLQIVNGKIYNEL